MRGMKKVLFLRQVQAFKMPTIKDYPTVIKEDNKVAMKMVNDKHSSRRRRHIGVKHHVVRDAVEAEKVKIGWKRTTSTRMHSPNR